MLGMNLCITTLSVHAGLRREVFHVQQGTLKALREREKLLTFAVRLV
jgi:hypothetical protein